MDLPSSLVKKFVDLTAENQERDGYYVYGTGIVSNGEKYVQLDGSDAVTSVSLATDLSTGDRVIVYVEDHVANVIGNITYPSSGRGLIEVSENLLDFESLTVGNLETINGYIENIYTNYVSTAYLESNYITAEYIVDHYLLAEDAWLTYATIDDLTATNARIDAITATEITVEYLEANYANITDLNVLREQVQNLDAVYATIDWVEAGFATIEELQTAYAYIYDLDVDFANIKNLLAGAAGVGDLETIHLTADNVVIDDAIIKSAMIENIAADKITSGTIYTSLVRIQTAENDTSLYLDTSLLQMSEDDMVRLQAGKDATGEYGFYIWNAEGAIMFDSTGATADGIGKEVIVNTHVADDANIAGYKLDITSVAKELNEDGSITVDATQVYIDGNTLDYALSEITDLIYGISMDGLKNLTLYYALYDSDTEYPPNPDEITPALTDEAETDYSFTDLYDTSEFWTTEPLQAGEGQYLWIIYWLEYEDGSAMWSAPICLTDGFVRRQTSYISTELEIVQGEILEKVWMTDITDSVSEMTGLLNTTISELWAEIDVTIGNVLIEVGDVIYDSLGSLTEQIASIEVESGLIAMTVESMQQDLETNYVTKGSLVLQLDENGIAKLMANVDSIEFYTDQISIDSTYFKLYKDGYIEATSGLIGNMFLSDTSLYNGKTNIDEDIDGVYIGPDGISLGAYTDVESYVFGSTRIPSIKFTKTGEAYISNLFIGDTLYMYNALDLDYLPIMTLNNGEWTLFFSEELWAVDIPNLEAVTIYTLSIECVNTGQSIINVHSSDYSSHNTDTGIKVSSWSGNSVWFGVGSGGSNRGIYDSVAGRWIVYADSSNNIHLGPSTVGGATNPIYLNSGVPTACTNSSLTYNGTTYGYQYGRMVWLRFYGVTGSTMISALNSIGKTPAQTVSFPMIYMNNSNVYLGYLYYNGSWMQRVAASYGGGGSDGNNYSGTYYGTICYMV